MTGRPTTAANPLRAKAIMRERRMSQATLAAQLKRQGVGVSPSSLSRYLTHGTVRGFDETSAKTAICKALEHDGACEFERAPDPFTQLPERAMLSAKARDKFRFITDPWAINCVHSDADVYVSPSYRNISNDLYYCAKNGDVMAVIGESGAGKSVLKKMFMQRCKSEGNSENIVIIQPAMMDRTEMRASHLCEAIVDHFGEKPKRSKEALSRQIHRLLSGGAQSAKRFKHVLLIDEAHDLPPQVIKYLKRFYELEHGYTQLISIVIFGQPELAMLLDPRRWDMREVSQRFSQVTLDPLPDAAAVRKFLELKLQRVEADANQVLEPRVEEAVMERLTLESKKGRLNMCYPLAIQNLMTAACNAAAKIGDARITRALVLEA